MVKQKRSENKKNNGGSSSNSNAGGGGGGGDKNGNSDGSSDVPKDKHHSMSTPCSNLAAAIAREIFPSAVVAPPSSSSLAAEAAGVGNNDVGNSKKSNENRKNGVASNNKKSKKDDDDGPSSSTSIRQAEEQQPLLGYMIQSYLLEERRKTRAELGIVVGPGKKSGSAKKKKNKKKKKKNNKNDKASSNANAGGVDEQQQGGAATDLAAAGGDVGDNDCQKTAPPTTTMTLQKNNVGKEYASVNKSSIEDAKAKNSASSNLPEVKCNAQSSASTPNNDNKDEKSGHKPSSLDKLLDSVIDSEEASANNGRGNRDIESFSTFLSSKLESHLDNQKQQQQQQSQQQKNNHKSSLSKTKATKAGDSTTDSSNAKQPSCCSIGTEFKDILPTISINAIQSQLTATICRKCRTSATSRLRHLIKDQEKQQHKQPFVISPDGDVEIEHRPRTFSRGKQGAGAGVVVLDEDSGRIKQQQPPSRSSGGGGVGLMNLNYSNGGYSAHGGKNKKDGSSSVVVPVSSLFSFTDVDEIENAFDYIAMDDVDLEAGITGQEAEEVAKEESGEAAAAANKSPLSFHLELKPISPASDKVRYMQIGTVTKEEEGDGDSCSGSYPMKTRDIIDLVKHILLPCGLHQHADDAAESDGLDEQDLKDIAELACASLAAAHSDMVKWKMSMYGLHEQMTAVEGINTRSVFDAKTPKILNDCDGGAEDLLRHISVTLFGLFKSTCSVGYSAEHGRPLVEFTLRLWRRYHEMLIGLVGPTLKHRGQMLRLAVREGRVPQAYTNKIARESLCDLVKTKIAMLDSLVRDFTASIKGGGAEGSGPSPVVRLYVLQAYRQHVEPKLVADYDVFPLVFPDQEGEVLFQRLIAAAVDLSQKTIGGGMLDGVKKKVQDQRNEIFSLCRNVRKVIIAMEDVALPETKVDFLDSTYKEAEEMWYDVEKMAMELERNPPSMKDEGDIKYETKDATIFLEKSMLLISQWMILLASMQHNQSKVKDLALPRRLNTWVESIRGMELNGTLPGSNDNIDQTCVGEGGERRVSSIMAALLYRWLEARCSEWHSELTRDELLQSMDMEEPVAMREGNGKSGKKKKAKRKNKGKNKDDKNEAQTAAQEDINGVADKKSAVDERITATVQAINKFHDTEVSQDEKKDESVEEGIIGKSQMLETESMKLAESVVTAEEIGTGEVVAKEKDASTALEGTGKQKKSKSKSGRDKEVQNEEARNDDEKIPKESPSTEELDPSAHQDPIDAQVEKKDLIGALKQSQPIENGDGCKASYVGTGAGADNMLEKGSSLTADVGDQSFDLPQEDSGSPSQEGEMDDAAIFEYHPIVGVIDGKHIIAAETYLVKRLQVIAGSKGTGKSPIVWM